MADTITTLSPRTNTCLSCRRRCSCLGAHRVRSLPSPPARHHNPMPAHVSLGHSHKLSAHTYNSLHGGFALGMHAGKALGLPMQHEGVPDLAPLPHLVMVATRAAPSAVQRTAPPHLAAPGSCACQRPPACLQEQEGIPGRVVKGWQANRATAMPLKGSIPT